MSNSGVIIAALAALAAVAWVAQLVRRDRLYVGYGVILVAVLLSGVALLCFPTALRAINRLSGSAETSGLVALAVAFVVLMLVYTLSQVTLISNRLTALVQELAIKEALNGPSER